MNLAGPFNGVIQAYLCTSLDLIDMAINIHVLEF